jgi:putative DNA primase/helicase
MNKTTSNGQSQQAANADQIVIGNGNTASHSAIAAPNATEPNDFKVDKNGLWHLEASTKEGGNASWTWISDPIQAKGLASDEHGKGSSLVVEFPDLQDASTKAHILPRSIFAGRTGEQVIRPLLEDGLRVSSNQNAPKLLRRFLMESRPIEQFLLVNKPGWYERVFALSDNATFGDQGKRRILFQSPPSTRQLLGVRGTFEDWISGIGTYARGNSRLQLGISAAFAAPLVYLTGEESGVIHLKSGSSKGKTTLLMVSGSVVGGGGPMGFVRSWLMTSNAVEIICEAHNDLLLPLDELKLCDPKVAGKAAYIVASGQGKGRGAWTNNSATMARTTTWRTLGLSSGEISLQTHMEAEEESLYGGQLVRFLEIPATANEEFGIFDQVPGGYTPAAFADMLKERCTKCYGAPLRKFLAIVAAEPDRIAKASSDITSGFAAEVSPKGASSEVHRAAKRLGHILSGGMVATINGCTDWDADEVWDNGAQLFKAYLVERGSLAPNDEERAIRQVRALLETNLHRFSDLAPASTIAARDQWGYRTRESWNNVVFLIWPETWAHIFCRGLDPIFVARVLKTRNYLSCDEGRLQSQMRVRGPFLPRHLRAANPSPVRAVRSVDLPEGCWSRSATAESEFDRKADPR